jgi:tRNA-dihydrouridine synthase B
VSDTFGFRLGDRWIPSRCLVAPMAGVTDRPFRQLCKRLGAVYAVAEMSASNPRLRDTRKSRLRRDHDGEPSPIVVQIAGAEPDWLADAARFNVDHGAEIIDINMGCPAKKVCRRQAGSALLADEDLVRRILDAVIAAVDVPVTLKIRLGVDHAHRNAVRIARHAEQAGVAMLVVHGRTRDQKYGGRVDFDAIGDVVRAVRIPVIANGDIGTPAQARAVLRRTGAAGVMIGRAGQGNPWLYAAVDSHLRDGRPPAWPDADARCRVLDQHVRALHDFYGPGQGLRVARKHIGWYLDAAGHDSIDRRALLTCDDAAAQLELLRGVHERLAARGPALAA